MPTGIAISQLSASPPLIGTELVPIVTVGVITGITQASSAVITINNLTAVNPFSSGQQIYISGVLGMTQINTLGAAITSTGGASGAWTITVAINSTAFSAYTSGGSLTTTVQSSAAAIINGLRTSAEISAGVTPTNYLYSPGDVRRYGAKADGVTDDSTAFQTAVNGLPAGGGLISVPDFSYVINTAPTWGTKSVYWNIGTRASFSGTGTTTFPRMNTNTVQVPVGPWIQSQSTVPSPSGGGIAALNVEMLQPATYVGQSVAFYVGSSGSSSNVNSNVWSINCLISANSGAAGTYQCIEVDVNNFSTSALTKGISISGTGTHNPQVALEIVRIPGTLWQNGITTDRCATGLQIGGNGLSNGILINNPLLFTNSLISGVQIANGADSLIFQRNTDTGPAGFFWRFVNRANTVSLASLDVSGNMVTATLVTSGITAATNLIATAGAATAAAGQINYGATTATSATTGTNGAVPAQVAGYIIINIAGTAFKIPYFPV